MIERARYVFSQLKAIIVEGELKLSHQSYQEVLQVIPHHYQPESIRRLQIHYLSLSSW